MVLHVCSTGGHKIEDLKGMLYTILARTMHVPQAVVKERLHMYEVGPAVPQSPVLLITLQTANLRRVSLRII